MLLFTDIEKQQRTNSDPTELILFQPRSSQQQQHDIAFVTFTTGSTFSSVVSTSSPAPDSVHPVPEFFIVSTPHRCTCERRHSHSRNVAYTIIAGYRKGPLHACFHHAFPFRRRHYKIGVVASISIIITLSDLGLHLLS
jgi:hypothetical protein